MKWRQILTGERVILGLAVALGLLMGLVDALLDYWFFYDGTFWELLITNVPPHEIYIRSVALICFVAFGVVASRMFARRRRTEETLRESKERYRALIEAIPDGIVQTDLQGKVLFASPNAAKLQGYACDEDMVGMDSTELLVPEDREPAVHGGERLLLRPDGARAHAEITTAPVLDKSGKAASIIGVVRDITQRKQVEEERQRHLQYIENMGRIDRVIGQVTDLDETLRSFLEEVFSILDCDRAWLVFPCDPDAPQMTVPFECARPEYPGALAAGGEVPMTAEVAEAVREALDCESPHVMDGSQGKPRPELVETYGMRSQVMMPVQPKLGKPWLFGVQQCSHARKWTGDELRFFHDAGHRITDSITSLLSLRQLRYSESLFRSLFENSRDGILLADPKTKRFALANPAMRDMLGYSAKELGDLSVADIHPPNDLPRVFEYFEKQARRELVLAPEIPMLRKDGSVFLADITSSPVRVQGEPRLMGHFRDVTERRNTERLLQERDAELAHLGRLGTLGEMVAGIAHEIGQPIQAISSYAAGAQEWLEKGSENVGKLTEALRRITEQARISAGIVRKHRQFAGRYSPQQSPVAIDDVLAECLDLLDADIRRHGVSVRSELAVPSPIVTGDYTQIYQVVVNLVRNACEAMRDTPADDRKLVLYTRATPSHVTVSVSDRGEGLPGDNIEELFEPFFTTKSDGMGMGLTVSSRIMLAHGGSLEATANPGGGATFRFTLPLASPAGTVE